VPLLRSMEALDNAARRLLTARRGAPPRRRRRWAASRSTSWSIAPTGRCARTWPSAAARWSAPAAQGPELEDHYFGSIPPRVQAFMQEVEHGAVQARRARQDPPQRGRALPVRARADLREANVAIDHNQLTMEVLQRVAAAPRLQGAAAREALRRHQRQRQAQQLVDVDPRARTCSSRARTPTTEPAFSGVLAAVLLGVWRYNGLLRAFIASYGPTTSASAPTRRPRRSCRSSSATCSTASATISPRAKAPAANAEQAMIVLGVSQLPHVAKDNTDRNRTEPHRLHRQQVRVPRRRLAAEPLPAHDRDEHHRRRGHGPDHRLDPRGRRRPRGGLGGDPQGDHRVQERAF
jgi:glutamine synthetase